MCSDLKAFTNDDVMNGVNRLPNSTRMQLEADLAMRVAEKVNSILGKDSMFVLNSRLFFPGPFRWFPRFFGEFCGDVYVSYYINGTASSFTISVSFSNKMREHQEIVSKICSVVSDFANELRISYPELFTGRVVLMVDEVIESSRQML